MKPKEPRNRLFPVSKGRRIKLAGGSTKSKISIEASRKALLADLKKKCNGKIIKKSIPFTNDDVPKYLKFLRDLEKDSRKTKIVVG